MSSKTLWVVTCEYNDYDQYGEYFEAVFAERPTLVELTGILEDSELAEHLLNTGGGRRELEDEWYWLREVQSGVRY
jgi:hypothetical protein